MTDTLRFALPPSLGTDRAGAMAETLQRFLADALGGDVQVYVAPDYAAVEDDLLFGSTHVAWGPPFVCARLQAAGGRFLLHAVRRGVSRYRAALVARKGEAPDLDDFSDVDAVWVSPDSTAGYLLPRQWLRDRGQDIETAFSSTRFAGSYHAAIAAVLDGEADVTAVYAGAEAADAPYSALDELEPKERDRLDVFAYTAERLNDGIVFAPDCPRDRLEAVRDVLLKAAENEVGKRVLADVFNAEALVATEVAAYSALYDAVDDD